MFVSCQKIASSYTKLEWLANAKLSCQPLQREKEAHFPSLKAWGPSCGCSHLNISSEEKLRDRLWDIIGFEVHSEDFPQVTIGALGKDKHAMYY